jgi:hypothetical protein
MWMQRSIWLMEWSYKATTCEKIMSFKQEWSEEESLAIKYPFSSNRKNIRFLRANSYGHPEITIMNFCLSGCSYMEIPVCL